MLLLYIDSPSVGTPLEELNTYGLKAKMMYCPSPYMYLQFTRSLFTL